MEKKERTVNNTRFLFVLISSCAFSFALPFILFQVVAHIMLCKFRLKTKPGVIFWLQPYHSLPETGHPGSSTVKASSANGRKRNKKTDALRLCNLQELLPSAARPRYLKSTCKGQNTVYSVFNSTSTFESKCSTLLQKKPSSLRVFCCCLDGTRTLPAEPGHDRATYNCPIPNSS